MKLQFLRGIEEKLYYSKEDLQLNLFNNQIGAEEMQTLATALQSGYCPPNLQIKFGCNQVSVEDAKVLAKALQSGRCPPGLQLNLDANQIDNVSEKNLQQAWKLYYAYQQEKFLQCMALQHGKEQTDSLISLLPQDILNAIYRYILPITPILAKMTEISAKVFRQLYASSGLFNRSIEKYQFDQNLATALSAKTFAERAINIKLSIDNFLQKELGTLEKGEFAQSPTIALLCKYHLIARNRVHQNPKQFDHFQLAEHQIKKLKM